MLRFRLKSSQQREVDGRPICGSGHRLLTAGSLVSSPARGAKQIRGLARTKAYPLCRPERRGNIHGKQNARDLHARRSATRRPALRVALGLAVAHLDSQTVALERSFACRAFPGNRMEGYLALVRHDSPKVLEFFAVEQFESPEGFTRKFTRRAIPAAHQTSPLTRLRRLRAMRCHLLRLSRYFSCPDRV
jgi:hypothetical protein